MGQSFPRWLGIGEFFVLGDLRDWWDSAIRLWGKLRDWWNFNTWSWSLVWVRVHFSGPGLDGNQEKGIFFLGPFHATLSTSQTWANFTSFWVSTDSILWAFSAWITTRSFPHYFSICAPISMCVCGSYWLCPSDSVAPLFLPWMLQGWVEGKYKIQETWLLPQAATAALSACFALRAAEPSFVCLLLIIKCEQRLCFLPSSSRTRVFHVESKGLNRASKSWGSFWDHELNFVYICIFVFFFWEGDPKSSSYSEGFELPRSMVPQTYTGASWVPWRRFLLLVLLDSVFLTCSHCCGAFEWQDSQRQGAQAVTTCSSRAVHPEMHGKCETPASKDSGPEKHDLLL